MKQINQLINKLHETLFVGLKISTLQDIIQTIHFAAAETEESFLDIGQSQPSIILGPLPILIAATLISCMIDMGQRYLYNI